MDALAETYSLIDTTAIEKSNLAPTTKHKYIQAINTYHGQWDDTDAVIDHVSRMAPGTAAHFSAALKVLAKDRMTKAKIGATPDNIAVEQDSDGDIEVKLPFTLTPDLAMVIVRPNHSTVEISVGDYLTTSNGNFQLEAGFNPQGLDGLDLPATLKLRIALGEIGYPGYADIESGWKSIKANTWKYQE